MGWNPVREAEKKAKQAVEKVIRPAVKAAEGAIWKVRKEAYAKIKEVQRGAEQAIDKAEDTAEEAVKKVGHEVEEHLREVGKELEEGLTEELPELLGECVQALAQAVTKEGLKTVQAVVKTADQKLGELAESKPGLLDAINDLGGQVEIGPLTLSYANFYTRTELVAGVLDTYINHPPELRRGPIIDMVRALGPDSVNLGISVQVVALVVGSKELGVGGGLNDISIDLFAELGDVILEAIGVPE